MGDAESSLGDAKSSLSDVDMQVGNTAAFLSSPLACAITGTTIYVDHGLHTMGLATDSPIFAAKLAAKEQAANGN
jgi:enoyl-[acyl-carrier-protein] reductase (NADH)